MGVFALEAQIVRRTKIIERYHGSLWVSFPSSAGPEGRFPAYKEIHERGIVRREEFVPVLWIATQI